MSTRTTRASQRTTTLRSSSARRVQKVQSTARRTRRSQQKQKQEKHASYLGRLQAEADADPNRKSALLALPRELICEIASHLAPESLVCLTLTCKEALNTLGTSSWSNPSVRARWHRSPETHIQHRPLLLELLLRDATGLEFCPRCNTLHPPTKPPRQHRQTKLTKYCLGQDAAIDYWPQDASNGYSLIFPHVEQVFNAPRDSPVDLLSGNCTVQRHHISHSLLSSARWVDGYLVLKQEHRLCNAIRGTPLRPRDVLSLPLCLCPHQSTTTSPPPDSRITHHHVANGPLLTHAVAMAFPTAHRSGIPPSGTFRKPKPVEAKQMAAADRGDDVLWRCTSCPTKFRVLYIPGGGGELVLTAWHCFGEDLFSALKFWRMLVRREAWSLGPKKRNSEFYSLSRSVPDFLCE